VELFSQDRRANLLGFPPEVHLHRPEIGALLPVYVADNYEGFEAKTFLDCTDEEIERYVDANVAAVREVAERERPAVGLANHLVMGPVILARALGPLGIPYAVKVHGSALEYVVKRDPDRFLPWAREGLAHARTVLVGSRHTGESLWEAMDDPTLPDRTRLGPPGVDVARFAPRPPAEAADGLRGLAARLADAEPEDAAPGSAFERDLGAAGRALATLDPARDRLVAYVGKLIVSKGVDLLAAAWPLVLARVPDAKLAVGRVRRVPRGLRAAARRARGRRPRRRARARAAGARGGGRSGGAPAVPVGVPRHRRRRVPRGRAAPALAGGRDRAPGARRARRPPAGLRGAGRVEHVPRGLRHGRRGGGRGRGAAGQRRALRALPR
jgi:glycosyltransferase involved in cell wall biosynthesis